MMRVISDQRLDHVRRWLPAGLLRQVNKTAQILFWGSGVAALFLGFVWSGDWGLPKERLSGSAFESVPPTSDVLRPEEAYTQLIQGRMLFQQEASAVPVAGTDEPIEKRWNYLGLLSGPTPQAIFEDATSGKTFYLYAGQTADGLTVEAIEGSSVLVRVNGQKRKFQS